MDKQIIEICHNIGTMIFECHELLNNVVLQDESLNEKQQQAIRGAYHSLINCVVVINNIGLYNEEKKQ